jgi:peptidyl-prolyl cis-trans isomerase D
MDERDPMTSTFRKKLRSGVLLAILGIALIAIVITGFGTGGSGIGGISGGQQAQQILEVGGEELTDVEVSRRMTFAYRQASRQQPGLDRGAFFQSSFDPMLEQFVDSRALMAFARQIGFVVPQSMVDREIVTNPSFLNVAGQYDDAAFRSFLAAENLSEQQIRSDIETAQLIRMITTPISTAARVPQAVAREYANLLLESRTGQLGAVPTAILARELQPSDQEIAAFYQQNQRSFSLPERRVLRFALIGREQLGDAVRASNQEVAAYYQQNQATYGPSETRSLQIFTTQDEAAARRLAERVRGGTNFVAAAQAEGFSAEDVNFPNLRREQAVQQTSEEVANAAFGAAQGGLVGPTRTPTGFKVVRVDNVTRAAGRPLEAVRAEIVTAVEQTKLADQINARLEQIEEQLGGGASFEEVARQAGLQVQTTPPITSTGSAPNFQFPQELAPLVTATFEIDPDGDPEIQVVQPDQLVALVQVANVVPPAAPPLDQIRDQVRTRLIQQTALQRGRAIAEGIVSRINQGMAPAQAYAQAGIRLPAAETLTVKRFQIARSGQQVPPPLTILFSIPEGRARMIAAPDGTGWIVVHHQRRIPGNAAADPAGNQIATTTQQELSQAVERELQAQFARAVRSSVEIERNEEAILALRTRLTTGN